jgi:hypothetical protein
MGADQEHGGPSVGAHAEADTLLHGNTSRTFTALERIFCRPPKTPASLPRGLASRNNAARSGGAGANGEGVRILGATRRVALTGWAQRRPGEVRRLDPVRGLLRVCGTTAFAGALSRGFDGVCGLESLDLFGEFRSPR